MPSVIELHFPVAASLSDLSCFSLLLTPDRRYRPDGSPLPWAAVVADMGPEYRALCSAPSCATEFICPALHPHLPFEPGFYMVHPCQTRTILEVAAASESSGDAWMGGSERGVAMRQLQLLISLHGAPFNLCQCQAVVVDDGQIARDHA